MLILGGSGFVCGLGGWFVLLGAPAFGVCESVSVTVPALEIAINRMKLRWKGAW